jgi:hypothetical protein
MDWSSPMSRKRFYWTLGLSLSLIFLGYWRHSVKARRERDANLFFAYVDGPLNDYAMATTRSLPALLIGRREELMGAIQSGRQSAEALKELDAQAPEGYGKKCLDYALPLHQKAAELFARAKGIKSGSAQARAWLEEEKDLREKLLAMLEEVRYETQGEWPVSQARFLELNALIYSLKEAQEAAKQ